MEKIILSSSFLSSKILLYAYFQKFEVYVNYTRNAIYVIIITVMTKEI